MKTKKKLAIVTTHPIQYNAPLFAMLSRSEHIEPRIFYTWSQSEQSVFDRAFDRTIQWDIPLLEGYEYEFVPNTAKKPGLHHFFGLQNPSLIQRIRAFHPDGILVYGWNYQSHLKVMRYFKGHVPVFFRGDSTLLDERKGMKQKARRIFLKWIFRHVDAAFYVGTNNRDYFLAHGLKDHQLLFAPHAIDNHRFHRESVQRHAEAGNYRERMGIGTDDTIIMFAGKLEPKKDPLLLIRAFKNVEDEKLRLVIVGNGILEGDAKETAKDDPRIIFLPFQNQTLMPVLYAMCDLFVLPSFGPGETWGLAVNEAMAVGKAILVSDKVGCAVDLVKEGINGSVFHAGDQEELAGKLRALTHSKPDLLKMGKASGEAIQKWSFDEICRTFELYWCKN